MLEKILRTNEEVQQELMRINESLLDSAIAMPQQGYDGIYLHKDIFEMVAAYLYYLAKNHPLCLWK